jgi:F-type H+-transporting ATPase subunit alpha
VRPAVNVGISVSRVGRLGADEGDEGRRRAPASRPGAVPRAEAFAAFASDLDAATRRQLDRGARTVEILKQPQYSPLSVEEQVMVIYAVTNGHLDAIPVSRIREWERGFLDYTRTQYPQVAMRSAPRRRWARTSSPT